MSAVTKQPRIQNRQCGAEYLEIHCSDDAYGLLWVVSLFSIREVEEGKSGSRQDFEEDVVGKSRAVEVER